MALFSILGGIAGSQQDVTTAGSTSGINLGPQTALESEAQGITQDNLNFLKDYANRGPGGADVTAGYNATKELAELFAKYSKNGGLPLASDITTSNNLASNLFGAQRLGLQQNFMDQETAAQRQAALMGRDMNDPILRAKLAQEQTRQSAMLGAEQNSWAQNFALNLPGQRLGIEGQRVNILQGLASQAMANRQALVGLGSQLQTQERNFRLATGTRWGTQQMMSGGGFKGAVSGAMAGAATDMAIFNSISGKGGGGGDGGGGQQGGGSLYAPQQQQGMFQQQQYRGSGPLYGGPMGG
jgi:hypothetical protein